MKSMVLAAAALVALADALPDNLFSKRENIAGRFVVGTEVPIQSPTLNTATVQGCFKSAGNMTMVEVILYNSMSECGEKRCAKKGFAAGGSTGGNQCWCGHVYPPKSDLVDDKNCNVGCSGYGQDACGGLNFWTIYNTGLTLAVDSEESKPSSSSTSATKTPTQTNQPEKTLVVTQSPTNDADSSNGSSGSGGGTNVAGIAAGVVVGVVVIAALIGGGFIYMRRKRNREIEEEHRRNAAVNAFIGKPPGSSGGTSMSDARLDPVMAHRRMSDGSIADNQDYSRRILRVTNA